MTEDTAVEQRRGPGRPSKAELEARHPKNKMMAKPNWEEVDPDSSPESTDRLSVPPEMVPDGMSLQWVTDTVYGQDFSQHRAQFEKRGWTPVHQSDFDSVFDGMFMQKGIAGEIKVEGLVLMTRPKEFSDKAKKADYRRARETVQIKESALRGGNFPGVTLDSQDPSALSKNIINRSIERLDIPKG